MSIHAVNRVQCRLAWDGSNPSVICIDSPGTRLLNASNGQITPLPVHFADAVDVLYV
ncbi:uncharacterized protein BXZ73DRAFT_105811 [Epithele typhae]|uniref:uncharacterized protein n=1 Tax=Epithele typhae TaxID=378194 RepID=UPI002007CB3D|nr:uncharacterized protein BXZ73DRAFT_105811 [Epithele typhae]KAH9916619.1 hypothetical protein BXZ73DRAFT_105811 [Epithele typhae]